MTTNRIVASANEASEHHMITALVESYIRTCVDDEQRWNMCQTLHSLQLPIKHGIVDVSIYTNQTMPDALRSWCFDLFEQNMKALYESSEQGYDAAEKLAEFRAPENRFVVLDPPGGYAMFRFDVEDDVPVVYCYELQVEKQEERRGIGRTLMDILHRLGQHWELEKVMVTVFKSNTRALEFYFGCKFEYDEISPSQCDEEADYEIMSRPTY